MAMFEAMASLDPSLILSRCCHSHRICLNPATKVIPFTHYAMGDVAPWRMCRDPVFVGAAVAGRKLPIVSPSAAKNDNHFEHLCRGPSSSSEERLLLDPAGEGEDILNDE
ncbi:hypothetical protein V8E54_010235 [Elaphomyces granulatus]